MIRLLPLLFISCAVTILAADTEPKINWVPFEEGIAMAEAEGNTKPVLIKVYTDWCGWCQQSYRTTYNDPLVIALINQHFIAIELDAETKSDLTFQGGSYSFVKREPGGYHQLAANLLNGELEYPTVVMYTDEMELFTRIQGFQTAETMHPILDYIGNKRWDNESWPDFKARYSPETGEGE